MISFNLEWLIVIIPVALVLLYFSVLGIMLYKVTKNQGSVFYNPQTRRWNVWFGEKRTSSQLTVVKYQGGLLGAFLFALLRRKVI